MAARQRCPKASGIRGEDRKGPAKLSRGGATATYVAKVDTVSMVMGPAPPSSLYSEIVIEIASCRQACFHSNAASRREMAPVVS